jgi:hypothetical protein
MIYAERHLNDTDMCDLVKDNVLPLNMSWTSLIEPLITTKANLEAFIFSRGVHLEAKELALKSESKTEPMAFPAYDTNETDENMQKVLQHLASLTARFSGKGGSRGGDRLGRGGGMGGETRSCYECGKKGTFVQTAPSSPGTRIRTRIRQKIQTTTQGQLSPLWLVRRP